MSTSHGNQGEKYTSEEWNRFDAKKTKNTQDKILDEHDNEGEKYTSEEWNRFIDAKKEENTQDKILNEIEETRLEDIPSKDIIPQILNKHLEDNFIIHSSDRFIRTDGFSNNHVTTVVHKNNKSDTRFMLKDQVLAETVREVIAGSLYKALLYDRSPIFRLVEVSDPKLKSKLLDDFIVLGEYIHEKKEEKLLDLVCEKLSDEDGRKELAVYMAIKLCSVRNLKDFIERYQEKMKGSEEFFDNILEKLSDEHIIEHLSKEYDEGKLDKTKYDRLKEHPESTELEGFLEPKNICVQMFEQCKNIKRESVHELFLWSLFGYIQNIDDQRKTLLRSLDSWSDKDFQDRRLIEKTKKEIRKLTLFYKSLNTIQARLDVEEFNKKLLAQIIEEIKKAEGIKEELINCINQELNKEVSGIEKVITSMMLLGYYDLHGGNIGIMNIKRKDRDDNEVTAKVYAKVDMTYSFDNLEYTNYLQYIESFKYMLNPDINGGYNTQWCAAVDYSKLKKEINKATDLFIKNTEYVKSLIHRALFYTKPLLRTEEELGLVNELAEKVIAQAKLLKEFANSEEFMSLKEYIASGYDNYIAWAVDNNRKIRGQDPIIYVMENNLLDSLIWKLKNLKHDKRKESFDWLKANTDNKFIKKWLEQYSLVNLENFQDYGDCIKYCNSVIAQREGCDELLKNKDKSMIKRLVKAVETNLNYDPPQSKPKTNFSRIEEQIKNIFPRFQKQCSLLSYESKRGIVKLSQENISTIDEYTRSSSIPSNLFFNRINLIHSWILIELNSLNTYTFQEYNEEKIKIVKEYLQVIEKYLECTSKILNKLDMLSDEEKSQGEDLVAQKLIAIEEILNPKIHEQDVTSTSGGTESQTQNEGPATEEAPIPTVVGAPQDPEPEVKFPDDVTFLKATNGETDSQPRTESDEQPQPEALSPNFSDDNYDDNQNVINKEYGRVRSEDDVDQQQNLQTQTKNNSKYYYIGAGATAGLAIGPTIAYFAGAAALAQTIAAVAIFIAAAVASAALGALVGYVVSKCLKNPNVEAHKQPEVQQPCAFP